MSKKNSKQRSNRLRKMAKRLAAYSAAAAVTVVATQDRSANAEEITHDVTPGLAVSASPGHLFNMISGAVAQAPGSQGNDGVGSFRVATWNGWAYMAGPAQSTVAGFVGPGGFVAGVDFYPDVLNAGSAVSVAKNFGADNGGLQYGPYGYLNPTFDNASGFVGLQFDIGGSLHYGWAEISGVGGDLTLHAFGYNDEAGAPSVAGGVIPEPSSIMLLAAGALGLGFWRKRRAGKAA